MNVNPRPNFFIVGAPKCGTTALFEYLSSHPDVSVPIRKEFNYFCDDLTFNNTSGLYRYSGDEEYLSYFSAGGHKKRIGEASVWYLYSRNAAKNIQAFSPDSKIIIMIRNPVDMIYSLYYQFLENGDEDIGRFEEALSAEHDRKRGLRLPKTDRASSPIEGLWYSEVARYTDQIGRYYSTFGKNNVEVIVYDDFRDETDQVYRRVLKFLDLDLVAVPSMEIVNPNRVVRSEWVRRFVKFAPYELRRIWRGALSPSIRKSILHWVQEHNMKVQDRPQMSAETLASLRRLYREEMVQLSEVVGRNLMSWVGEA